MAVSGLTRSVYPVCLLKLQVNLFFRLMSLKARLVDGGVKRSSGLASNLPEENALLPVLC